MSMLDLPELATSLHPGGSEAEARSFVTSAAVFECMHLDSICPHLLPAKEASCFGVIDVPWIAKHTIWEHLRGRN